MTAAYERGLYEQAAGIADELPGLASDITSDLGGARNAGLDPDAVRPLTGAAIALGADKVEVFLAGRAWPDARFLDDRHFLGRVADAADDGAELTAAVARLAATVSAALTAARADWKNARPGSAAQREAAERISVCKDTLAVLASLHQRLRFAVDRLDSVPEAMGETYEAAYALIRNGGQLPHEGRWLTGEDPSPVHVPGRS